MYGEKMKLKTLKDIEKLYDLGGEILIRELDEKGRDRIVTKGKENRKAFLNHLKQEGIKWLKRHEAMAMDTKLVEDFIKHFFNIKEDLK